jgi:L-alanine-DL-glutamate epimerase-like enolase superfamily enzyme
MGERPDVSREMLLACLHDHPFAASAILSAWDMAEGTFDLPDSVRAPILHGLQGRDAAALLDQIEQKAADGFVTLKLKVGRDAHADFELVSTLLDNCPQGLKIRIDANQGYTREEARWFFSNLEKAQTEIIDLVEQPLSIDDWEGHRDLIAATSIPIMLDESILDDNDVLRANSVGASFIKLKLAKHGGIDALLRLAKLARDQGMGVVLGNGVATGLTNLVEGAIWQGNKDLFHGDLEANGFARSAASSMIPMVQLQSRWLTWTRNPAGGEAVTLDEPRGG